MSSAAKRALFALWWCVGPVVCGCVVDPAPLRVATLDEQRFASEAYPVLLRDCGFPACHGTPDRFFSVYGPGRTRLLATMEVGDPATPEEIHLSYERARSMIDAKAPATSLLLRKPLGSRAGGAGHKGEDSLGRNVYQTVADPNFQVLRTWSLSLAPAPSTGVRP